MPLPDRFSRYLPEAAKAVGELRSDEALLKANPGLFNELRELEASILDRNGYTAPFPENLAEVDIKDWYLNFALESLKKRKHTADSLGVSDA